MRKFADQSGREWVATVREEVTPRHFGRWYLIFRQEGEEGVELPMPEVRWQTRATGERTLRTMGEFELRRRLGWVRGRAGVGATPGEMGRG